MTTRNIHVISHTHWDREWYLTFQQFRLKLVELVDGLLELLEEDPHYLHFMLDGQTIVLEDYLQVRPGKEAILRQHINNGRIIIGPWHILPDMFLVGAEAHIRNLLLGDQTCRKYGRKMMVGYVPDSFGHFAQMPQVLRGFGIDSACVWRGLDEEPCGFWWQGPDGSQVFMAYLRESYSNGANLPGSDSDPGDTARLERFASAIAASGELLAAHSSGPDILVMLGTDHMPPARSTSESIEFADKTLRDTRVIHSTLEAYIDALRKAPVSKPEIVVGELRACRRAHLLPGVLSARMNIKQRNVACENLLTRWVEPFTTFAERYTQNQPAHIRQPAGIIHQAWRILMENHPHDSICGSVIDQVAAEMMPRFDQVDQIGEELTRQSLQALAASIDTRGSFSDGYATVVVFNPSPFTRSDTVSVEITLPQDASSFELISETGELIPYDTEGLGASELINVRMSPDEIRSALALINDGLINGFGLRAFNTRREGDTLHLDAILAAGRADVHVWHRLEADAKTAFDDVSIRFIHVRAHTAEAVRAVFTAPGIPGLGWRVFAIRPLKSTPAPVRLTRLTRAILPLAGRVLSSPIVQSIPARLQRTTKGKSRASIENEHFGIEVEQDGTLTVLEKNTGRVFRRLNRLVDGGDAGDEYNYSPPQNDQFYIASLKTSFARRNAARQSLTIDMVIKVPSEISPDRKSRSMKMVEIPVMTVVTLNVGLARIDIHTKLVNNARDHRLRVHFPTPFKVDTFFTDSHFDIQRRAIGLPAFDRQTWVEDPRPEAPQRAFCQVYTPEGGLTLANRGLPEVEGLVTAGGTEIALTLLRCVGWLSRDDLLTRRGHAGPALETPGAQMSGEWSFDYALLPHAGSDPLTIAERARGFEAPLRAVFTPARAVHSSGLAAYGSFVEISPNDMAGSFCLSTIKQAEDGSGWLLRGYNTSDDAITVNLKPLIPFKRAALANIAEQPVTPISPGKNDGSLSLVVKPRQIVTVWFGD